VTLLKGQGLDYRALVTDINLKGRMTDGMCEQADRIDLSFPIVYITGAAADDWASHGVPNSISRETLCSGPLVNWPFPASEQGARRQSRLTCRGVSIFWLKMKPDPNE